MHRLGREPQVEEIAQSCGIGVPLAHQIVALSGRHLSLHHQQPGHENLTLIDLIEDRCMRTEPSQPALKKLLDEFLAILSARERDVLSMRYGLSRKKCTLAEVAKMYAISRERVRQIERKAVDKLRHNNRRKELDELLSCDASTGA